MGEVWKAWDNLAERHVVIKTLPSALQASDKHMGRVKSSFQQIHALQHQHICPVYDLGYDEYCGYYLVMKFIDGGTLLDHRLTTVEQKGEFTREDVVALLYPWRKPWIMLIFKR